jgi:mutual gliding-motility protein MglA
MPAYNPSSREVRFKIVYCGAGWSGKTTNLSYIHSRLDPSRRGELISLATAADRTLFFDFMPVEAMEVAGCRVSFQLYTVPGQAVFNATRQIVLRGVDGIVFVIDSDRGRLDDNLAAWRTTWANLRDNGVDPSEVPLVLQYNKRDVAAAMAVAELEGIFNSGSRRLQSVECVAGSGWNVFSTLSSVSQTVLERFFSANQVPGR